VNCKDDVAVQALLTRIWNTAGKFETAQCNAIRDLIHEYNYLGNEPTDKLHRELCLKEAEGCGEAVAGMIEQLTRTWHVQGREWSDFARSGFDAFAYQMAFCAGHWGRQALGDSHLQ
jgi:hypothetical protein